MHVAEMDYEIAPSIKELLIDFVQRSDLGYLGPVPEVAAAFAGFAERHWNWQPDTKQIRIATDVGVASVELFRAIAEPGDRVVINSPVYHSFYEWIAEAKLEVQDVPLIRGSETWNLDISGIEAAFASGAKFLLLCSPHNPMGRVHSREELAAIAELAKRFGVVVVSDEIHAPLTYPNQTFTPWLAVSEAARQVGITVTAASKSFNLAGLKASIIVTQDSSMHERLSALPAALHWRSSLLGAFAMAEAFSNCDDWLVTAVEHNQAARDHLTALMHKYLPEVPFWVPQGGYLAWLDLTGLVASAPQLGDNPALRILEDHKISLVPGDDHGPAYAKFVRINLATHLWNVEATVKAIASYV
jgi:cystathionine beta-lyase